MIDSFLSESYAPNIILFDESFVMFVISNVKYFNDFIMHGLIWEFIISMR